jgi:dihydrofolate reductase
MATTGALLLGRRTYEDFASVWPQRTDNPSTLLVGDATDAVADLKDEAGGDLVVLGSGELIQSLRRRDLIDSYVLLIHPLILGRGRRLFPDGSPPSGAVSRAVRATSRRRVRPSAGRAG